MAFPRQEYWSELLFPSLGNLPGPGIELVTCLAGGFFTTEPPGKPKRCHTLTVTSNLSWCWLVFLLSSTRQRASLMALWLKNLTAVQETACNAGDLGSIPGLRRSPVEETANHPVFLPGRSHGKTILVGYRPWGPKTQTQPRTKPPPPLECTHTFTNDDITLTLHMTVCDRINFKSWNHHREQNKVSSNSDGAYTVVGKEHKINTFNEI